MTTSTLRADDPFRGYKARIDVEPRFLFPGSNYRLTITAPAPSGLEKTFYLGRSGVSFGTFMGFTKPHVYTGIAKVTSLEFDREGLTVKFLAGSHQAGDSRALPEKTRYIPRKRFPKINFS